MKPILRSSLFVVALPAALAAVGVAGCSSDSGKEPSKLPPGVVFTYPLDGQVDVPAQANLIFQFTDPVDPAVIDAACTLDGTAPQGGICIVGSAGLVPATATVLGGKGNIVSVTSSQMKAGESYQVFVLPGVLSGAANLAADAPLITFRTRRVDSAAGAPELLSVSGEAPAAFGAAADRPALRRPVLDSTTLRLVFSEALDERSLTAGTGVTLRRTDGAAEDIAIAALLQNQILVVDPDDKLAAGGTYELTLTGLTDRGGNALPATTLTFQAVATPSYSQTVEIDHPGTIGGPGGDTSEMTGAPYNSVVKRSPLIGLSTLGVLPGTLNVELGDPGAFGGPIPFTLPKGQRLAASELALKLAGIVDMGYQTGSLYFDLVSDANGWVTRNPYRDAAQTPDDRESPLIVELFFDASLTAEDGTGNAMATQTMLNVHLIGEATSVDGQLVMEAAGAIEVDLLGVSRSTADLSLRMRTGAEPVLGSTLAPRLVSTFPARGATDIALDVRPQILLSNAVDLGKAVAAAELTLTSAGGTTPVSLRSSGGALVVVPRAPLTANTAYTLTLGRLFEVGGKALELAADDASAGTGVITFTTSAIGGGAAVAPQLAAIVPGAPCALTGGSGDNPGHCAAGENSDRSYLPFTLPADRSIEARFTQPMSATTLRVGTACGSGAIRVEVLNAAGACTGVVAGEVTVLPAGFRFTPLVPLVVGGRYRLTLVPGTNGTCDAATEVCGANGRPFNSDPLDGIGSAGGPAVVAPFVVTEPTRDTGVTSINLATALISDRNANGTIDTGESGKPANELAVDVASVGGIVTSATVTGPGEDCYPTMAGFQACLGIAADLPVQVLPKVDSCPVDANGAPTTSGEPCVPVRITAQGIRTTSLSLRAIATALGITIDVSTGLMHIRLLEQGQGAIGYILSGSDGKPVFVIAAQTLMDAPDLTIALGIVSHDVNSKPVNLTMGGPVTFLPDGRMQVVLQNLGAVIIPVNVSTAGLDGRINLRVPDRTLSLTLNTPALR